MNFSAQNMVEFTPKHTPMILYSEAIQFLNQSNFVIGFQILIQYSNRFFFSFLSLSLSLSLVVVVVIVAVLRVFEVISAV
jgi:hypothetical protein